MPLTSTAAWLLSRYRMLPGAAKRLVWSGLGARVEAQLPEEARTVSELSGTADAREGLAAVIERRAPLFGAR